MNYILVIRPEAFESDRNKALFLAFVANFTILKYNVIFTTYKL